MIHLEIDKAEVILQVLLNKPNEFELKEKPTAIRTDFVCTFNSKVVPIEAARADGNGAYVHKGCPKRFYHLVMEGGTTVSCTSAKNENGTFVINERQGARYVRRFVPSNEVYMLARTYRSNKLNPNFVQMLATVRRADQDNPMPYYIMSYRWNGEKGASENFIMGRHGNAAKPHSGAYSRQDPNLKKKVETKLSDGLSCSKVYREMIEEANVCICLNIFDLKGTYNIHAHCHLNQYNLINLINIILLPFIVM